jgi:hypothetical protein
VALVGEHIAQQIEAHGPEASPYGSPQRHAIVTECARIAREVGNG